MIQKLTFPERVRRYQIINADRIPNRIKPTTNIETVSDIIPRIMKELITNASLQR